MTIDEAIKYCYEHEREFINDLNDCGEEGEEQFSCLLVLLKNKTIKPSELKDYGMDY